MDLTNRVLIVTGALIWIFIVLVVILLAWAEPEESISRLRDLAGYLADHNTDASKLIISFGGFILVLLAGIVIVFEVAPPEAGGLKVAKVGAGQARISTDEITHRLEAELRALPDITDAQATVQGRGQKAEINLELHVGADADLTSVADEACRRTREVVEQQMGVGLSTAPKAQLHYRELRVARPQGEVDPAQESSVGRGGEPPATAGPSDEHSQTTQDDRQAGA